jgi:hypothetical protein
MPPKGKQQNKKENRKNKRKEISPLLEQTCTHNTERVGTRVGTFFTQGV